MWKTLHFKFGMSTAIRRWDIREKKNYSGKTFFWERQLKWTREGMLTAIPGEDVRDKKSRSCVTWHAFLFHFMTLEKIIILNRYSYIWYLKIVAYLYDYFKVVFCNWYYFYMFIEDIKINKFQIWNDCWCSKFLLASILLASIFTTYMSTYL